MWYLCHKVNYCIYCRIKQLKASHINDVLSLLLYEKCACDEEQWACCKTTHNITWTLLTWSLTIPYFQTPSCMVILNNNTPILTSQNRENYNYDVSPFPQHCLLVLRIIIYVARWQWKRMNTHTHNVTNAHISTCTFSFL